MWLKLYEHQCHRDGSMKNAPRKNPSPGKNPPQKIAPQKIVPLMQASEANSEPREAYKIEILAI